MISVKASEAAHNVRLQTIESTKKKKKRNNVIYLNIKTTVAVAPSPHDGNVNIDDNQQFSTRRS